MVNNKNTDTPNFKPHRLGMAAIIIAIFAMGVFLIARFSASDMSRDVQNWQEKLNLIAESRAAEVGGWVSGHFKALRALSDNPSLQLYLSEKHLPAAPATESGQKAYLRNLILFTAQQSGFSAASALPAVHANVPSQGAGVLAVLSNAGEVVVSTAMSADMEALLVQSTKEQPAGQEYLIDIRKDSAGQALIGFVLPVYSIQGERNAESQIGRVVGIKPADESLFSLLEHPGVTERTLEAILVRAGDGKMDYLSPLKDGTAALSRQSDITDTTAESHLAQFAGTFTADKADYRGATVLATSRAIAATPWAMVVKIDAKEALAKSAERRAGMVAMFVMIIIIVTLIIAAIWWHAYSRRAMMMSSHFRAMAAESRAQEQLLRLVTDYQPEPTYIIDTQNNYQFANQKAAKDADMMVNFLIGKSLQNVRGTNQAEYIRSQCKKALQENRVVYDVMRRAGVKGEEIIRSAFVPLRHIPVATLPDPTPGVLVVEQDISDVVHERERRLSTQDDLIQTLVKLVDARDPFAANHSLLVSKLAYQIAVDMDVLPVMAETTRIAGSLMNIGKILVSSEMLTKTSGLTESEKKEMHESIHASAALLEGVSFDGPVSETLRQWQERWDGSGPLALKGEAVLISARIIAVANAFIGMISPRSWRNAIPIESANKFLIEQSDAQFDRKVVVALVNYVENHHGRKWIEQVLAEKRRDAA